MIRDSATTHQQGRWWFVAWGASLLVLLAACTSTKEKEEPPDLAISKDVPEEPESEPPSSPDTGEEDEPPIRTNRTDVCVLYNGDRITGEIKGLDSGLLRFKTDRIDTIQIEWKAVTELTSGNRFRFDLQDGTYYLGSLARPMRPRTLRIVGDQVLDLQMTDVVLIAPAKTTFWERVDGRVSLGFDFTRSTDIAKYDLFMEAEHLTDEDRWATSFSSTATNREAGDTLTRNELGVNYRYFLQDRWFVSTGATLTSNEEQGIDLRTALSATGGNKLVQSNRTWFLLAAGLSGNREFVAGSSEATSNLEAVFIAEYRLFWYDHPEMNMTNDAQVYPGLTDWGRIRAELNSRWRWELIRDLYWEFRLWLSYDSDPPSQDALRTDWGTTTSLGYSF